MSDLVDNIKNLESKAQSFDDAVERLMNLKNAIQHVRSGDMSANYLITEVERLISFYEPSSKAYIAKIDADGYHESELKKYSSSTFNGKLINRVCALKNNEVFVTVVGNDDPCFVGMMSDDVNCYHSADYILCSLSIDGLELKK